MGKTATGRRGVVRALSAGIAGLAALEGVRLGPSIAEASSSLYLNVQDYGATGNGSTDDSGAIGRAIAALGSHGGTLAFPAGTYLCTNDVHYSLNSQADNGSIKLVGAGQGASTIKFSGSNLVDGQYSNWNTGYTKLVVLDLDLRFVGAGGKGFWLGGTTLPRIQGSTLGITGSYADNSVVLLGSTSGPVGVTGQFKDVTYEPQWSGGNYVTGICLHFDTFEWDGGSIVTNLPTSLFDPRLLWLQPVFMCRLKNLVPYVPSTDANKTFALINQSEPQGSVVVESCGWYRTSWNAHFNASGGSPNLYVHHCALNDLSWPLKTSGTFGKIVYQNNPGYT